jgi:tetratricopeptide (TPR) repeat protein
MTINGRFMKLGTRSVVIGVVALTSLGFFFVSQQKKEPVETGIEKLRRGEYAEAVTVLSENLASNPTDSLAARGLITAYTETGRHQEAEKTAVEFLSRVPSESVVRNLLGEIYFTTGKYQQAQAEFDRAIADARGPAQLRPKLNKGTTLLAVGKTDEAKELFQTILGYYNANDVRRADELSIVAQAITYLEHYHDANSLYIEASKSDPEYIETFLSAGDLYVEKYNYGEAAGFFRDALKVNSNSARAYLGMAKAKRIDGSREAVAHLTKALEINPNLVEARNLMAAMLLESEEFKDAQTHLERALQVNPNSTATRSLLAASQYLLNRPQELQQEIAKVSSINPRCGELYETLGEFAVSTRRYQEAVDFARKAVELSPRLWRAWSLLGINLLRLGKEEEGREVLEKAFAGDPFNVWVKNTLDLLDTMRDYRQTVSEHFVVKAAAKESDLIGPYVASLLEEAYSKLTAKYQFRPQGPIIVEVFQNHEDFAVKTLGLPGLGALGACFGKLMAMDSPAARDLGSFNWGSTAWHEFAHVITLQLTDQRVPRWLSEGLSVYEERKAKPGWGDDWNLMFMKAFADGRFLPMEKLDSGFMRPQAPDQVPISYFQASLVVDHITEQFGFDKILAMLRLYREGKRTHEIFASVLGTSLADFDRTFKEYVEKQARKYWSAVDARLLSAEEVSEQDLAAAIAQRPENFVAQLRLGVLLRKRGEIEKAAGHFKEAIKLFPYYTGEGSAYWHLAEIYQERGRIADAIQTLEQLVSIDEEDYKAAKLIVTLALKQGGGKALDDAVKRAIYINPYDIELHQQAGEAYLTQGDSEQAVKEFRAALILNPPDRAEAQFNLARALAAKGDRAQAKKEVLKALEIAPGMEKAQQLLLKLTQN